MAVTLRMVKAVLDGSAPPSALPSCRNLQCTEPSRRTRRIRSSGACASPTPPCCCRRTRGQRFEAIATEPTPSSTFVRVSTPPVEGVLAGRHADLDVGETLRVKLVSTEVERGFIDFVRDD